MRQNSTKCLAATRLAIAALTAATGCIDPCSLGLGCLLRGVGGGGRTCFVNGAQVDCSAVTEAPQ